jgi:hypothetical protein
LLLTWRQKDIHYPATVRRDAFPDLVRLIRRCLINGRIQSLDETSGLPSLKLNLTRDSVFAKITWRNSLIRDYKRAGVLPGADDAWSWSMWRGYLDSEDGERMRSWFDANGARACHIHTSGHAPPDDLRAFAQSVAPKRLVPIHGIAWDNNAEQFSAMTRLSDGQVLAI